jgi:hypothetical protein
MHPGGNDAKLKQRLSSSSLFDVKMSVEFIRRGISVILIAVLSLLLAACGAKPTPDTDGVIGSYVVKGTNP